MKKSFAVGVELQLDPDTGVLFFVLILRNLILTDVLLRFVPEADGWPLASTNINGKYIPPLNSSFLKMS